MNHKQCKQYILEHCMIAIVHKCCANSLKECQGIASTCHYAEIGERSRDAPTILPAEQSVNYTMIQLSGANKGSTTEDIQVRFILGLGKMQTVQKMVAVVASFRW